MGILSDLFSGGASDLVDSVGGAFDDLFTSDEEKLVLKNKLVQIKADVEIKLSKIESEIELTILKEITRRQEIDMMSDSWLSKNIRPMAFIYMLMMTTLFTFSDGNLGSFVVKLGWIELWTTLTVTFAIFYAGGRTMEKWKSMGNKKQSTDAYED